MQTSTRTGDANPSVGSAWAWRREEEGRRHTAMEAVATPCTTWRPFAQALSARQLQMQMVCVIATILALIEPVTATTVCELSQLDLVQIWT